MESPKKIKVAVIGSGLAGLSTAYLLSGNDQYEAHLFEKGTKLGMDAASMSIGNQKDEFRVDVPMRSFMSGYYNHLVRLYDHLAIPSLAAKFSFGWYRIGSPNGTDTIQMPADKLASHTSNTSHLVYSGSRTVGWIESAGPAAESVADYITGWMMACWKMYVVATSYLYLMFMSLWLYHRGHLHNQQHPVFSMTLGRWFEHHHFHPYFIYEVFVPLFAAVCTNSWKSMLDYPAADILEYMAMGLFQESYVVSGGVRRVVDRLSAPLKHIHLETQIVSIQPSTTPGYRLDLHDASGNIYSFHHVVFATQANQACRILRGCIEQLVNNNNNDSKAHQELLHDIQSSIRILQQFEYDRAVVVNHTDKRLLPDDPCYWRSLNLASLDTSVQHTTTSDCIVPYPHDTTMTTHILNLTHHSRFDNEATLYMQTTNPCISPDPAHVLSTSWFERATVTLESKRAILDGLFTPINTSDVRSLQLGRCQGPSGLWFVGSYSWPGIPLLEGCVASAEMVVTKGIAAEEQVPLVVPW